MNPPRIGWVEHASARSLSFLAGVVIVLWALRLFGDVSTYQWLAPIVIVLSILGLGVIGYSCLPNFNPGYVKRWPGISILIVSLVAFSLWSFTEVAAFPAYGTDEIAFDQYAAILAFHGHNPYVESMAKAFEMFRVSPNGYTFLLNGKRVLNLSYPALSFLLYFPTLALGITYQGAVITNIVFWIITIALLYALLPENLKMVSVVLGASSMFISYAVGGVTDPLFMPFLLIAAYRWDDFVISSGWKRLKWPIAMGLAMSIKQNAWVVFIFMVIGLLLETRYKETTRNPLKVSLSYALIAITTMLVTNIPYIFLNPIKWFHGVTTPFLTQAVPAGQGLIELTIFSGLGGGSLEIYGVIVVFAGLSALALFVKFYRYARYLLFLTPSVVLFFSSRSFSSYLVTMVPVVLIGAISIKKLSDEKKDFNFKALYVLAPIFVLIGSSLFAIADPPPLSLNIVKVVTTGQLQTIDEVTVVVHNWTNHPVKPSYTLEVAGADTQFWNIVGSNVTIKPGATSTVVLTSASFYADPSIGQGFEVVAYTQNPPTVSVSQAFSPQSWHVILNPVALRVSQWPVGKPLNIQARVLDKFNRPVNIAGIPIYLGQVIYGQSGVELANAIISVPSAAYSGTPGETPVAGYTNSQGIVTFSVTGTQASKDPTYFEANLQASNGLNNYPYGYSEILAVRFG
jgi:uncharacterized membrane protein